MPHRPRFLATKFNLGWVGVETTKLRPLVLIPTMCLSVVPLTRLSPGNQLIPPMETKFPQAVVMWACLLLTCSALCRAAGTSTYSQDGVVVGAFDCPVATNETTQVELDVVPSYGAIRIHGVGSSKHFSEFCFSTPSLCFEAITILEASEKSLTG